MGEPREEYASRLTQRQASAGRLARVDGVLGWAYLAGIGALFVTLYFVAELPLLARPWLFAPACALAAIALAQSRVQAKLRGARSAVAFYERGLARLDGSWSGSGPTGERFTPTNHPCAHDLDVVGAGSLFQLICAARTSAGESALARMLLSPPGAPEVIRARQAVVAHLRPRLDLREALAVLAGDGRDATDPTDLAEWGEAPSLLDAARSLRAVARVIPLAATLSSAGWALLGWGPVPLLATAVAGLFVSRTLQPRIAVVIGQVWRAHDALRAIAALAAYLERVRLEHPALLSLQRDLRAGGRASRHIAALGRRVAWLTAMQNDFAQPLVQLVGGVAGIAFSIEAWRRRHGRHVRTWLEAVGQVEALCALASHAYEHPADPFPEIAESGRVFDGQGLGHPQLPESSCIRNDLRLGEDGPALLLLSGSNMSGKSTFLRTIGANAALAFAGAPVRATRLRLSPFRVGASLRTQDSLMGGSSRFYAEITRLRQVIDLTDEPRPVLFLLDEILAGTNSHDRKLGAEGVLSALVEHGAIGICTTHDLALTDVVESFGSRAANAHFGDRLEEGRIHFEYRLRPGVVRHSNAIELMRAVGLRV